MPQEKEKEKEKKGKNLGSQAKSTEVSLTYKIQDVEESISSIKYKIEEVDISVKQNIKSKGKPRHRASRKSGTL